MQGGAVPGTPLELVLASSTETRLVLALTFLGSLVSWFLIVLKWWQYRQVGRSATGFFAVLGRTRRLHEALQAVGTLAVSPYTRLFKEAMHFYAELRPGVLEGAADAQVRPLPLTQLEALKMVLAKEIAAEREALARYVPWLATIGSVSPLLGLLGTVLGVMNAFIGIATKGSGNLGAVAPGVAEALITTVAGLAAAIPAVIAYNIFVNRVRSLTGDLEGFANELIGTMAREGLI